VCSKCAWANPRVAVLFKTIPDLRAPGGEMLQLLESLNDVCERFTHRLGLAG